LKFFNSLIATQNILVLAKYTSVRLNPSNIYRIWEEVSAVKQKKPEVNNDQNLVAAFDS